MRFPALLFALLSTACATEIRLQKGTLEEARVASEEQRWDAALELWSHVLAHSQGEHAEARLQMGRAFHASGDHREALRVLRTGTTPPGTDTDYWRLTGHVCLALNQIRGAGQAFTKVLTYAPDDRATLVTYGTALLATERAPRGVGLCLQALRLDPGDGLLAERVAQRSAQLGHTKEAFEAWALRLEAPNPPAEAYLHSALIPELNEELVGERLQRALELDPQMGPAWRHLGTWHRERGEAVLGMRAFRKAVEVDPADIHACLQLTRWCVEAGDCVQGRFWADHALAWIEVEDARAPFEELLKLCD